MQAMLMKCVILGEIISDSENVLYNSQNALKKNLLNCKKFENRE